MPSIYQLKTAFQDLLRPQVRKLEKAGITANQVTVAAFLISLAVGVWLALTPENRFAYFAYPFLLLVRMALNAADGMLAREFGQKSKLGAFLNELCDVLSDAALYLALGFLVNCSMWLAAMFAILAVATEVVGLTAIGIGASRRYDGPMGKSDRAFAVGALMFFAAFLPAILVWTNFILSVLCALCAVTIVNRIKNGLAEAN